MFKTLRRILWNVRKNKEDIYLYIHIYICRFKNIFMKSSFDRRSCNVTRSTTVPAAAIPRKSRKFVTVNNSDRVKERKINDPVDLSAKGIEKSRVERLEWRPWELSCTHQACTPCECWTMATITRPGRPERQHCPESKLPVVPRRRRRRQP